MAKKKKKPIEKTPPWHKHVWWVIALSAVFIYLPSFNNEFTLDDIVIIEENTLIRSLENIPDLWRQHYWAGKIDANDTGLYRPFTLTTYAIQYSLHGKDPIPYHILNVLLHALACVLLFRLVSLLFRSTTLGAISGLLFAMHPLHTEAVSGIVGRAEILCAIFILGACIVYHHWRSKGGPGRMIAMLLLAFGAMMSKEHGFMLVVIIGLQEMLAYKHTSQFKLNNLTAAGFVFLLSAVLWWIRSKITGPAVPHEEWLNVPASDRIATAFRTLMEYAGLHLLPIRLSADYWTDQVKITGLANFSVFISIILLAALVFIGIFYRKKHPPLAWGIFFFLVTILPVSNLLFAAGFLKAERILYIPSIGLIVVMSYAFLKGIESRYLKIPAFIIGSCLLLFYIYKTVNRQNDWQNNYTLALATLKLSPESPRFNNMMGLELKKKNLGAEAITYFEKAVASNPNHIPAVVNLANAYRSTRRLNEAATLLENALKTDPTIMATYVNLMGIYREMENYTKNLEVAQQAVEKFPQSAAVLWNAANAYHIMNQMEKADELRARARAIDPSIGQ